MKLRKRTLSVVLGVCAWTLLASLSGSAQLIEPTRVLNQERELKSTLTVLSEPPGLQALLDGTKLGVTPLFGIDVDPGTHVLRVEDKQASIQLVAGKPFRIALFKGSFLLIPEPKVDTPQPEAPVMAPAGEPASKVAWDDIIKKDPFYWPMNPVGPIY